MMTYISCLMLFMHWVPWGLLALLGLFEVGPLCLRGLPVLCAVAIWASHKCGWVQGRGHRVLVNGQWITVEWITVEPWITVDNRGLRRAMCEGMWTMTVSNAKARDTAIPDSAKMFWSDVWA